MITTRWWLCVTMETSPFAVEDVYTELVIDVFYIVNSTVIDWTCFLFHAFCMSLQSWPPWLDTYKFRWGDNAVKASNNTGGQSYYSLLSVKVAIFMTLYAILHVNVTNHFLEGFWRKPIVAFPQLLIQIQSKYCYTFRLLAMAIVKTFRKSYITLLK